MLISEKSTPKYKIIADDIEKQVNDGILKSGDPMNSELKTQQQYNVSRVTVRKAYKVLLEKGILRTVHGVGTFINDLHNKDWTWMDSFTKQVTQSGHVPTTRVKKFQIVKANDTVAKSLGIKLAEECYFIKRVRYIDNHPRWVTRSYIPLRMVQGFTENHLSIAGVTQSIFKVLEMNFGITCTKELKIAELVEKNPKEAALLNVDEDSPLLMKFSVAYDTLDNPIVYEQATMLKVKSNEEESEWSNQMKLAVHMSMFCKTWVDDIKPSLEKVKEMGFNGAEISLYGSSDEEVIQSCKYARELGLEVICGTGVSAETDPSSQDPSIRQKAKEYLMSCVDKVHAGDGMFLNGVLYAPWQGFSDVPKKERWENAAGVLKEVGLYAKEKNIGLNIEVINRFETDFFNRIEEAVEFLKMVDVENVKLLVDTFHMNIEEDNIFNALEKNISYIGCVHISENHRGVPGTGHIEWEKIISVLKKNNYKGYLDMETFVEANTQVGKALFIWDSRGRDSFEEANKGIQHLSEIINQEISE